MIANNRFFCSKQVQDKGWGENGLIDPKLWTLYLPKIVIKIKQQNLSICTDKLHHTKSMSGLRNIIPMNKKKIFRLTRELWVHLTWWQDTRTVLPSLKCDEEKSDSAVSCKLWDTSHMLTISHTRTHKIIIHSITFLDQPLWLLVVLGRDDSCSSAFCPGDSCRNRLDKKHYRTDNQRANYHNQNIAHMPTTTCNVLGTFRSSLLQLTASHFAPHLASTKIKHWLQRCEITTNLETADNLSVNVKNKSLCKPAPSIRGTDCHKLLQQQQALTRPTCISCWKRWSYRLSVVLFVATTPTGTRQSKG